MTAKDKATLKGYFNTGDIPTEDNFSDLIDSIDPSGFTELTAPSSDDLLWAVDDPSGTPASKKVTVANMFSSQSTALSVMTENTAPALTDILYLVDDPTGTPTSNKITISNLLKVLQLQQPLNGTSNVAIGPLSLNNIAAGGNYNVAIGASALEANLTGDSNIGIGYAALYATTGNNNIAIGANAMQHNIGGGSNVAVGASAAHTNETGTSITAIGHGALALITLGPNTALGANAGASNTSGANNVYIGDNTGRYNATGSSNTILGSYAGYGVSGNSFSNNILIGTSAGYAITTGGNNILIGKSTGDNLTTGTDNIYIGYDIASAAVDETHELNIGGLIKGHTAATLELGFYGTAAVAQPSAIADATDAPSVIARCNDVIHALEALGLIAS